MGPGMGEAGAAGGGSTSSDGGEADAGAAAGEADAGVEAPAGMDSHWAKHGANSSAPLEESHSATDDASGGASGTCHVGSVIVAEACEDAGGGASVSGNAWDGAGGGGMPMAAGSGASLSSDWKSALQYPSGRSSGMPARGSVESHAPIAGTSVVGGGGGPGGARIGPLGSPCGSGGCILFHH